LNKGRGIILIASLGLVLIAVVVGYERYFVQRQFGPSSLVGVFVSFALALMLSLTYFLLRTRWHEVVVRTWLIILSVSLTFIVVDLIAAAVLVKPLSPMLEPDAVRHHKLIPNTNSRIEQPEFSYIQHVNNLGLRGKETSLQTPQGHYRVLVLGDSFTMGKGVEDDQTFSALLETSFNLQKRCGATVVEVLNGGVDSYAPILSFLQLSRDLARLETDLVLLHLDLSDLLQEAVYRKEAVFDERGEIVAVPGRERSTLLSERLRFWIDQHTFFTRLLLFYVNRLFGYQDFTVQGMVMRANQELLKYTLANDQENRADQWSQIFDSITMIKRFVESRGGEFALVVYPWGHQVRETEWVPGRYTWIPKEAVVSDVYLDTVSNHAKERGIELINLFSAFRSYKGMKPLYFKQDMHWTPEGHKVMAQALEDYLIKTHLQQCGSSNTRVG
jgi:lysophospholipase L1-like esterase